jgi:uncharacterized membrane protein YtjA (UPF0391 family)
MNLEPEQALLNLGGLSMLRWSLLFLVIALVAGMFGFGLIAAGTFFAAKILFFVFLVLFVVSLIAGGRAPKDAI